MSGQAPLPGAATQPQPAPGETVHLSPPDGAHRTPCCGETPFDLPRADRITNDPSLATCGGPEPQPAPCKPQTAPEQPCVTDQEKRMPNA
jgi:hypothetical protein